MKNRVSSIVIREIDSSDIELFTAYRLSYLCELLGEPSQSQLEATGKGLTSYFKEALAKGRIVGVVALDNSRAVSFGALVIKSIPGDFLKPLYLEGDILNMYTIPSHRNRGISSLILEYLIGVAKKREIRKLSLHTTKAGERLYRKYGFKEPQYPVLELNL